jgi:hypothetical protein
MKKGGAKIYDGIGARQSDNDGAFGKSTWSIEQATLPENQRMIRSLNTISRQQSHPLPPVIHRTSPSPVIVDDFVDSNLNPLVKGSLYIFADYFSPLTKYQGTYDKIVDQPTNEIQFINVRSYPNKRREFANPKMIIQYGENTRPELVTPSGGKRTKTRRRKSRRNRRTKSRRRRAL